MSCIHTKALLSIVFKNGYEHFPDDIPSAKMLSLPKEAAKLFYTSESKDLLYASMGLLKIDEVDDDIDDDEVVNNLLSLSSQNNLENLGKKCYLFLLIMICLL